MGGLGRSDEPAAATTALAATLAANPCRLVPLTGRLASWRARLDTLRPVQGRVTARAASQLPRSKVQLNAREGQCRG